MKKVLLFEVIGVKSLLVCYFFDLNPHFFKSVESVSAQNSELSSSQWWNSLVNTAKADRKRLPTEKLFSLVMFFGRDENLTFTQLEQRLVKIHRGFYFRRFRNWSFMPKFKDNQSVMNPNLLYPWCTPCVQSIPQSPWTKLISYTSFQAMLVLYRIVKWSLEESVPNRDSAQTRNAALLSK